MLKTPCHYLMRRKMLIQSWGSGSPSNSEMGVVVLFMHAPPFGAAS